MEIQKEYFENRLEQALNARVKVSGGNIYVGQYLNQALVSAEDVAKQMGGRVRFGRASVPVPSESSEPFHEAVLERVRHYQREISPGFVYRERESESDHG